jgi:cytochrome bd-type quinol oxidase subunit 2
MHLAAKAPCRRRPVSSTLGRMKTDPQLSLPAQLSVAALVVLGLLGGSLIVAHSGFETSPRRSVTSTFVPAPEAYFLAAIMYLMSCIAMLALLRNREASKKAIATAFCAYIVFATSVVAALNPS